jgi:D-arginine dehydrogenase
MAGTSVAAELATTHRVVLVEREDQLAHHATGRSAAAFLESYGPPPVRALTRASRPLLEAAADESGVPLLTPRPLLWVAGPDRAAVVDALLEEQPTMRRLGAGEAAALCPVLRTDRLGGVAVEPGAQDMDVAGLHQHYLRTARARGVTVVRSAGVVAAEPGPGGDGWRLRLADGATLAAGAVVDAAGAWADEVAALFGARPCGMRPLRRTIAIARPTANGGGGGGGGGDSAQPLPLPPEAPLVADVDDGFYFKPEGPHVLVSPADETPSAPCDARPDEADVALALERVNGVTTLGLRSVVSTWAGLRTFAPDRVPVVGADPSVPGLFWLAGQGGYGIQTAPALARLTAALVRGDTAAPGLVPDLDLATLSPARFAAS